MFLRDSSEAYVDMQHPGLAAGAEQLLWLLPKVYYLHLSLKIAKSKIRFKNIMATGSKMDINMEQITS